MSKLVLSDVTNISSITTINANFEKIQEELQEKVLYRDNPDGEPNHMSDNLDMNGNKIINAGEVRIGSLVINGVPVEPSTGVTTASAFQVYEYTATEGQTTFSVAPHTPFVSSLQVEVNGLSYPPSGYDVSGTDVIIPSASAGDEVVIRRFVNAPTTIPTAEDITFILDSPGAASRTMQEKAGEIISLKDYGAVGDGVANDTAALNAFFSEASGNVCLLPAGTYKATTLLSLGNISGARFIGVPGQTKITGSFGYGLIYFDSFTDVTFEGIAFESTYTNAAISSNTAVVYGVTVNNVRFDNCSFTSPNANTQGLVVFARTSSGDTTGTIDGLWVENCEFVNIGQTAITLMNRGTASDKYQAARRVFIKNNYAKDLGLNNSYGFFVSLDGYGSEFEISDNIIENCYLTAIENVGWWNGKISGNKFRATTSHTKAWRAIALDGASFGGIQNVSVKDNKLQSNATVPSYVWDCSYCDFSGNIWTFTEAAKGFDEAFKVVDSNYNTFSGEVYRSDDKYAIRLMRDNGNCKYNQFVNCIADTSASLSNTAVVNFDGTTTTNNEWDGYLIKGSGGSTWTQTTSAANNLAGYDEVGTWTPGITFATPGNLNAVVTSAGRYTRQGRLVTVTFEIDTSTFTHTTASGNLQITGLPFAPNSVTLYYGSLGAFRGITKVNFTQFQLRTVNGQTYLGVYASGSAQAPVNLTAADMPTGGTVALYGTITYEIA